MSRRLEQMNSLLQERIGNFLLSHFETPPGVLVTITRVETAPDLRSAKVYLSVLPENNRGSILEDLRKVRPELHQSLYRDLETHSIPLVRFMIDETELRAANLNNLIDSLHDTG